MLGNIYVIIGSTLYTYEMLIYSFLFTPKIIIIFLHVHRKDITEQTLSRKAFNKRTFSVSQKY